MAVGGKTRNMFEGLVKEGSFKWLLGKKSYFDEELEEMERSPSAGKNFIRELSPVANLVVRRCSKILRTSSIDLQESFNQEASDSIKHPSRYARNLLEYCCFKALFLTTQMAGHLFDKTFRRLTFDMMLAWEVPAADSQPLTSKVDEEVSVGLEAFCRIAPSIPIIADVIISENLFEALSSSTDGRLQFPIYDKYLSGLERAIRKMKSNSESSLLAAVRSSREEKILEVDGTVTTQPVLEHVGISTWPGRLILTDHALHFEALRVVSYDKPKRYDLSEDLKQVVKPELTGPWGTRLFDKAVFYSSSSLSEPVILEFPELKGHARRDYWLAIIHEVLYVHKFISKYGIKGVARDEVLWKAVLGILRLQAIQDISSPISVQNDALLMFNLCDQLPGGDLVLETLANMANRRESDRENDFKDGGGMRSISALDMVSNLGFVFGTSSNNSNESRIAVGEISVGEMTELEIAIKESKNNHKKVISAQATVDGVKVDGIDTNLAVMKELLFPINELWKSLQALAYWDDLRKSSGFCLFFSYIIYRNWLGYAASLMLMLFAVFMIITRWFSQGKSVPEVKVIAPPPMNTMEQLLAVQNAVSQAEQFIQDGNVILLKLRGLLLSIFPQATEKLAFCLLSAALILAFMPYKYIVLLLFLEIFTRYSPLRKTSTERLTRRLKEWWFSVPAAPVTIERDKEEKKKK
ncbi:uncharacterized protein LOC106773583 isoform X1 [Vigna radiata var. radiata]|uniref:Uncharacterized protein LOC106773583 isoform X1 n=1 Tax=Vigna radiata var. radiata TaxID=3916 RepID=A0A1S3VBQ3_VIGRR|nr:uncharacterized protein LOC106773583 isoform X1 [Vigna radiata var. radiata]XP_014515785.1 uncharacterized protein LOC106773583 isoform X1 [Vigna radiata var. radiata]